MRKGQFRFCANYVTIRFGKTYEPTKGMFNMNKITIIGTGSVGATIAYTLNTMGIASEIVLIDINTEKALGEALDIRQGNSFFGGNCSIYAGDYCDAAGSNIVILTSGIARKPGQTCLELAQTNVNITKSILPQITKYAPNAIYIIVSNPVDILTYVFSSSPDFLQTISLVRAPFWTHRACVQGCLSIIISIRPMYMHMYSVNTAIRPSFRGRLQIFPECRLRIARSLSQLPA